MVLLLVGILIGRWALLAVLEAALGWRSVALLVLLLLRILVLIALRRPVALAWRWVRRVCVLRGVGVLVSLLRWRIALALTRRGRAVLVRRVLIVVLAAVLIVWVRHRGGGGERARCGVRTFPR